MKKPFGTDAAEGKTINTLRLKKERTMSWTEIFPWKKCARVSATIDWSVDCYHEGPPPVVIEFLNRKREFFEKLVKLLDIRRARDARAIIFAKKSALDLKFLEISTSFGIYVAFDEDFLMKAIKGEDVFEVNSAAIKNFRNREALKSCRGDILELLNCECLTLSEIVDRLSFKYERNAVKNQVRNLLSSGKMVRLCRLKTGEVVYGLPGKTYRVREDLSKKSKNKYIRELVLNSIKSKPMNYLEISESLGLSKSLVTSTLRELKKEGVADKRGDKWIFQTSGEG